MKTQTLPLLALILAITPAVLSAPTIPISQPQLSILSHYGSACPSGGLSASIGPIDPATNISPLTFTLSNFRPVLGSFTSSLRMCDIIANITYEPGYRPVVNKRGTQAWGFAGLDGNTTLGLRGTWQFTDEYVPSIGMLEVDGPVQGEFKQLITPVEGDKGVAGPCKGAQLDIEFQARAARPSGDSGPPPTMLVGRQLSNETSWTLSSDIEFEKC